MSTFTYPGFYYPARSWIESVFLIIGRIILGLCNPDSKELGIILLLRVPTLRKIGKSSLNKAVSNRSLKLINFVSGWYLEMTVWYGLRYEHWAIRYVSRYLRATHFSRERIKAWTVWNELFSMSQLGNTWKRLLTSPRSFLFTFFL
jgi:hypothetical protein